MKNKINYTISMPHNQICTVSMPLSSPVTILHSHMVQGLKSKNLILHDWNLIFFFYKGVNRNSPKLQGVNTY